MANFRFRLETLLKLRRTDRDQRGRQLAEAGEAERLLLDRSGDLAARRRALQEQTRRTTGPGPIDVDILAQAGRYEAVLEAEARTLDRQTRLLAEEIQRRRQALLGAERQVRVLEKYRSKLRDRHRREALRAEVKEHDELVRRTPAAGVN